MLNRTLAKADLALAILVTDKHGNVLAASPAATEKQRPGRRRGISTMSNAAGGP